MDLSAYVPKDTAELQLTDPRTGAALPMWITSYGKDSETFRKLSEKVGSRRLERDRRRGRAAKVDVSQWTEEQLDVLVACTASWRQVKDVPEGAPEGAQGEASDTLTVAGKDLPCTPENVRLVYTRYLWIREQVDEHMGDRADFMAP
jgi:hypothetical protein